MITKFTNLNTYVEFLRFMDLPVNCPVLMAISSNQKEESYTGKTVENYLIKLIVYTDNFIYYCEANSNKDDFESDCKLTDEFFPKINVKDIKVSDSIIKIS